MSHHTPEQQQTIVDYYAVGKEPLIEVDAPSSETKPGAPRKFTRRWVLAALGAAGLGLAVESAGAFDFPYQIYLPDIKANFNPYFRRFETLEQVQAFVDMEDRIVGFSDLVDRSQQDISLERIEVAQLRRQRLPENTRSLLAAMRPEEYEYLKGELPSELTPLNWLEIHVQILNNALDYGRPLLEGSFSTIPEIVLSKPLLIAPVPKSWVFFPHDVYYDEFWRGDALTSRYPFREDASWVANPYFDFWTRKLQRPEGPLITKTGDLHEEMHAFFKAGDLYRETGRVISPQDPSDPNHLNLSFIDFCRGDMMSYPATPPELFPNLRLGPLSIMATAILAERSRSLQYEGYERFFDEKGRGLYSLFPERVTLAFEANGQPLPRGNIVNLYLLRDFKQIPGLVEHPSFDEEGRLILEEDKLGPWHAIVQLEDGERKLELPFPRYFAHFLAWTGLDSRLKIEVKEIPNARHSQRIEVLFGWELESYLNNSLRAGWGEVARTTTELPNGQRVYLLWTAPLTSFAPSSQEKLLTAFGKREKPPRVDWQKEATETEKALKELREQEGDKFIPKL